jgi:hypothetical protein
VSRELRIAHSIVKAIRAKLNVSITAQRPAIGHHFAKSNSAIPFSSATQQEQKQCRCPYAAAD